MNIGWTVGEEILFKSEKRSNQLANIISLASSQCIDADCKNPREEHLMKLVHVTGNAHSNENL